MNKNILFITPALNKAGAETQLIKLACFVKSKNNNVLILSLLPKVECMIDAGEWGLKAVFLKSWKTNFFSNIIQLKKIIKEFKPDLVIAFMFIAIIFARVLKKFYGFSLISSVRALKMPAKWYLPFTITSGIDDVVVYNATTTKQYFEQHKLVKDKGIVINNAITIPALTTPSKKDLKDKCFLWICVAHFRSEKDYLTLFKAIALIKNKNFKINIIGNLFNQTWPFKVIEDLNIKDKVNIMGYKSNATDYLQEADAFVVSSFTESMPNAILEAMANGKPVVATAVGGVADLINAAGCGTCFKQGDEYELASKMCQIMESTVSHRSVLALNGRTYIERHFSERRVMESWMKIIKQFSDKNIPVLN